MDMLKVAIIGICGVFLALFLKQHKPEYSIYISLITGVILFFYGISKLETILTGIYQIEMHLPINMVYMKSLIKIVGVTYLAEFTGGICKDAGFSTIANQVEIFGKLAILAFGMPIITALLETVENFFG